MSHLFVSEVTVPPSALPVTVTADQVALAAAVVDEVERTVLWRAVVEQTRKILVDGFLPQHIELEPVSSISITRWTPADAAVVVDSASYEVVTRDPAGTIVEAAPGTPWPEPERPLGSFSISYVAGWPLASVPASVVLMIERAIEFRAGSGSGDLSIGSLKIDVAPSYETDRLPAAIASIGRAWAYRPGLFAARP